jgi:hypothetical protein
LGEGVHRDVGGPFYDRPLVGTRFLEEGVHFFVVFVERRRFGAKPALLEDYVALGVELAEDGVQQAVGLEPGLELQPVLGDPQEVRGLVLGGERVQELAAVPV